MTTQPVRIINVGRGPQIEGHRLTVMDVFYYVHRGHDYEFIHRAMPTLRRDEYDAAHAYIQEHYEELERKDREIDERHARNKEELKAKGLYQEPDLTLTEEQHLERLHALLQKKKAEMQRDLLAR